MDKEMAADYQATQSTKMTEPTSDHNISNAKDADGELTPDRHRIMSSDNCVIRLRDIPNDAAQIPPRQRDIGFAENVEDGEEREAIAALSRARINPSQGAVTSAIDAAAAYAAFLAAIAARDFDRIYEGATGHVRGGLRNLQSCIDFAVLFGLWCESYPASAKSVALHCDEHIAVFDIVGEVDGAAVRARVRLCRCADRWLVDKEEFTAPRPASISGPETIA